MDLGIAKGVFTGTSLGVFEGNVTNFLIGHANGLYNQNALNSKIINDGLMLYYDAGKFNSYPTSGINWYDLSGRGNHGILTSGPTYNNGNGGSIVFDGTNDIITINKTPKQLEVYDNSFCFEVFCYPTSLSGNDKTIFGTDQGETRKGMHLAFRGTAIFFGMFSNDAQSSNGAVTLNAWNHVVWNFSKSTGITGTASMYSNAVLRTSTTLNSFIGDTPILMGDWNGRAGNDYFVGNIAIARIYNRGLTASEVLQNYNAHKSRFGL